MMIRTIRFDALRARPRRGRAWFSGLVLALGLALPSGALGQGPDETVNQSFEPEPRPVTDELVRQLSVPPGFTVNVFARDLGHARMLAVSEDGTVYLACTRQNQIKLLRDRDGDGAADEVSTVLENLDGAHGIFIQDNVLYLAGLTEVWSAPLDASGRPGPVTTLVRDLPDPGQHDNRTIGVGPDGRLYLSLGSSCNACEESNPLFATLQRMELDGQGMTTLAAGLRNTLGFDWHPDTEELWGMDNGSDGRGPDIPPEELNRLEEGKNYGWPFAYADRRVDPLMTEPQSIPLTKEQFAAASEPSVRTYQAHSAPLGLRFARSAAFPDRYRQGAFVTLHGSWNRYPPVGHKVLFLPFENGEPGEFEDFLTGFLIEDGRARFGRPVGLAVAGDGALLFTDDQNGVIYRVAWTGAPPADPDPARPQSRPSGVAPLLLR